MSGGGSKTSTQQKLAPEQAQILEWIMPSINKAAQAGAQQFPGERVAGFTPAELQGQKAVAGAATGPMQSIANNAAQGTNFLTSGAALDPRTNPGLAGAVQAGIDPLREQFLTSVMPQVRSDAILSGQFGGSEQAESTGLASNDFLRQVGNTTANIVNPAYQAGLNAMTRGLAIAPGTAGLQTAPGQALAGVGGQQRAMEQAQLDAELQKFIQENYGDLLLSEEIAQIAFGLPIGEGVTRSQGGGPGKFGSALGGAASGAALGSLFGPPGSVVGTGVGAGLGGLLGFLS